MSLKVENLCRSFQTRSGDLSILRSINLELNPGDAIAIIGPSGSGKSTLLQILGTLDRPTSGSLQLHGIDPFQLSESGLADFRNHQIGFIFQDHHLLPQCDVLENVLIPTFAAKGKDEEVEAYARKLLDQVGLSHRIDHMPSEISGGERQRVAIARALIHQPKLLLADEPTGNLDRTSAEGVAELLTNLPEKSSMIQIVVTHSLDLAKRLPRCFEMNDGQLLLKVW
jgi:lipoprotein-releasing system ATP-binding protein